MTHPMIVKDAKELAGQFYENARSDKFRESWPDQMTYVNTQWTRFVQDVRETYAQMLGMDQVKPEDKELIYEALIEDAKTNRNKQAHSPLPIFRNTEAFVGDRRENMRTTDKFGKHGASLREKLRSSAALFTKH